jgi:hypothetical protein
VLYDWRGRAYGWLADEAWLEVCESTAGRRAVAGQFGSCPPLPELVPVGGWTDDEWLAVMAEFPPAGDVVEAEIWVARRRKADAAAGGVGDGVELGAAG